MYSDDHRHDDEALVLVGKRDEFAPLLLLRHYPSVVRLLKTLGTRISGWW